MQILTRSQICNFENKTIILGRRLYKR